MFLRAITILSQIFTTTGSTREVPGLLARCYTEGPLCAGVAELVDAPDSKSGSFTGVSVRFRPSVPRDSLTQATPNECRQRHHQTPR